jgi:hypothetical protein
VKGSALKQGAAQHIAATTGIAAGLSRFCVALFRVIYIGDTSTDKHSQYILMENILAYVTARHVFSRGAGEAAPANPFHDAPGSAEALRKQLS